ncbi:unnamed protein product, partial [Gadus morhua 'NCC']
MCGLVGVCWSALQTAFQLIFFLLNNGSRRHRGGGRLGRTGGREKCRGSSPLSATMSQFVIAFLTISGLFSHIEPLVASDSAE